MRLFLTVVCMLLPMTLRAGEQKKIDLPGGKGHFILVLPEGHDPKQKYDAVVALHGAGDTAPNFAASFQQSLGGRKTVLAVPEAGSPAGPGFTWSPKDLANIVATVTTLSASYGVDPKRVMLTGHSAGCFIGFYVMAQRPDLFACFGGTAAGIDGRLTKEAELKIAAPKVAVYYGCGKQDPNHAPLYKKTVDLLTKLGFNLLAEEPDIGHTLTGEQIAKMLGHFDAASDKVNMLKLAAARKSLDGKQWGAAETALAGIAADTGPAAAEARALLDKMRADFTARLDAAKALTGAEAAAALAKIQKDYPHTTAATEAKKLAAELAKKPK